MKKYFNKLEILVKTKYFIGIFNIISILILLISFKFFLPLPLSLDDNKSTIINSLIFIIIFFILFYLIHFFDKLKKNGECPQAKGKWKLHDYEEIKCQRIKYNEYYSVDKITYKCKNCGDKYNENF